MGRIQEVACLIRSGFSPRQIQMELQISFSSVRQYLISSIGAGLIQGYEVIFSIAAEEREAIEDTIQTTKSTYWFDVYKQAQVDGHELDHDVLKFYLFLRDDLVLMKDMYSFISKIEVTLHRAIKYVLVDHYGPEYWWRNGVSMTIRKSCALLMEEDVEPGRELYCYTNFIQLKEILDNKWPLFAQYLPNSVTVQKLVGFECNGKLHARW